MMVVDGRQTGYSEGLTMIEAGNYMMSYGATEGIDLDGGGSSTMVMNFYNDAFAGQVLNSPSDGSERSVGVNVALFALPNGDYNQNGTLDAADYVVWRKSIVGQSAYDAWRSKFGNAASGLGSGSAVPEPTTWFLMTLACFNLFAAGRCFRTYR
jgi:phosphodiester glycosidase